jgi:hypothetical protein
MLALFKAFALVQGFREKPSSKGLSLEHAVTLKLSVCHAVTLKHANQLPCRGHELSTGLDGNVSNTFENYRGLLKWRCISIRSLLKWRCISIRSLLK